MTRTSQLVQQSNYSYLKLNTEYADLANMALIRLKKSNFKMRPTKFHNFPEIFKMEKKHEADNNVSVQQLFYSLIRRINCQEICQSPLKRWCFLTSKRQTGRFHNLSLYFQSGEKWNEFKFISLTETNWQQTQFSLLYS